jgi:hypothetical protein
MRNCWVWAYNRWLADYCKPYPDRLFGAAMLPLQSVELAITEMRYARKELGMRSGCTSLTDDAARPRWSAECDPFSPGSAGSVADNV